MSKTSISENTLKSTPLPSITGLDARAPRSPRPRIAVPLEITATRLPLEVYSYARLGSSAISKTGIATPGEYASERSRCVSSGLVGRIDIFPGLPLRRWYSRASSRVILLIGFSPFWAGYRNVIFGEFVSQSSYFAFTLSNNPNSLKSVRFK